MIPRLGFLLSILVAPLLCIECIGESSRAIASMLEQSVSTSIGNAPTAGVRVAVDGRDIILNGKVSTQEIKAQAAELAMAVPGVRTVTNNLTVGGDAKAINTNIGRILLNKKIEFEPGKDILLPASIPVLQDVLAELKKGPDLSIQVDGHTDNAGKPADNRVLSEKRAEAVVHWFADNGIAANRMQAAGYGPDKPIAPNVTPEGRMRNRRVEITTNGDTK